jgi:hypothetical protein
MDRKYAISDRASSRAAQTLMQINSPTDANTYE